ncbi:MAG TPA: DoxX family protein [Niabella sp.]|nr:DoxX family protein [Niabella sp.]
MNTILWLLQILAALAFLYSGVCKLLLSEKRLVAKGQTGVEGLRPVFIKFIGISEIAGVIALIAPMCLNISVWLTPLSALCLAFIMPFAAIIHYKRKEAQNVLTNVLLFAICIFIAYGRTYIK